MGNAHIKPHPRVRNKKQVHWKAAGFCFGKGAAQSFDIDRSAPPGKPELLPDTEGTPDLVTLRWTRPINDGGSPISGYLVEHRRVGSPHWVRATPLPVPFPEITLSGLEPGWRYQFRVSAENAVGYSDPSETSEPITVTLQRSAITAPKFTQEVTDTVALENEKCEFVVHFLGQPPPKVYWFKDGFEIFSSRRIRILTEHDRSVLTIHQTSLSDEGEIKCTATNKAGHVSSKARLTVEAPPSIRLPRNYEDGLLFELGEIIRLKVSVVGRPTPLVFWTHNGESLQNNDRYEIEYTDKSFSLKIADATRSDRGEYQIKAVNKLGEDTASFLVTVTDKPSPPGKAKVVMTLGRSVTLSWNPPKDDGGCKIGNYIVEYYRLGWNVWLKAATSRQLSTRLGDLIEGSEYKFRIKAESPYGVSDPSEESEVVFIPDPKRGLTHPPVRGRSDTRDYLKEVSSPVANRRKNKTRSQSSSRVEFWNSPITEPEEPPLRPKRTKSKSQQQTPEASPMLPRKELTSHMNKNIFDRSSLARDLAYGMPDLKVAKDARRDSISNNQTLPPQDVRRDSNDSISQKSSKLLNEASKVDHTIYKVKIESPKEALKPIVVEPMKKTPSPELKTKLIREHSATLTGSSEFMLVLYSDENVQDQSNMLIFDDNAVPPPLSLSAPELAGLDQVQFPPLKNSASSTELLHERAMDRFYQAAEAEANELEKRRALSSERRPSHDIPKIQINSTESDDIIGLDRRHSLRRKSAGTMSQQNRWSQKRHSLKNPSELKSELFPSNLNKFSLTLDKKRELMMLRGPSTTSEELTDQEFERKKDPKKTYTQSSFIRKPVSVTEEEKWKEEYEESLSESESDSESDIERFKFEVSRTRRVHLGESFDEEDTYRPPGGLSGMRRDSNEPFEILSRKKELPDPNFVPKPILKKTDSPSVSPNISPVISPPPSPTKTARALSPRPDVVLQRNRSKSLAVPVLPPLMSSSGDESDEPKKTRNRSLSLTTDHHNLLPLKKELSNIPKKNTSINALPSISTAAQISGIAAASIVIPKNLLEKKKNEEETKVVADHYEHIVKSVGQRRRSNPFLSREELKKAASHEDDRSSKEKTPSKENLSQDSGYQSVSSYRRSSFTDHYDSIPIFRSPVRQSLEEVKFGASTSGHLNSQKGDEPGEKPMSEFKSAEPYRNTEPLGDQVQQSKEELNRDNTREGGRGYAQSQRLYGSSTSRDPIPSSKSRRSVSRSKSPTKRGTSISRKAPVKGTLGEPPNDRPRMSMNTSDANANKEEPPEGSSSKRRPMLREIMTQTSGFLESFELYPGTPDVAKQKDDELLIRAEVQVKSAVDWLTDLAMFAVACWLYLFENELLAIPVLLVMVYRQLKEEARKRIPRWLMKRLEKKKIQQDQNARK